MAKIVIAGTCDCPFYARVELLADKLSRNLPNFVVTKIVKLPEEWTDFTKEVCQRFNWPVRKSPLIWRELVDRGGKGVLIGGADEFQEYVVAYYKILSDMSTKEMLDVASDNTRFLKALLAEQKQLEAAQPRPRRILIIGASSVVSIHLLPMLANHGLFGHNSSLCIQLYDEPKKCELLENLKENLLYTVAAELHELVVLDSLQTGLEATEQVIILDVVPKLIMDSRSKLIEGLQKSDGTFYEARQEWLRRRYTYFSLLGLLLKKQCHPSTKVLVAGNPGLDAESKELSSPVNFDVAVLQRAMAPTIPPSQIVGLSRSVEQSIKSAVALHLQVRTHEVTDVIVWGNIGGKTFVDLENSNIYHRRITDAGEVGGSKFAVATQSVTWDKKWLNELPQVTSCQKSTDIYKFGYMCQAAAIFSQLQQWWNPNVHEVEQMCSLVTNSQGFYNIPKDVVFSFPVTRAPTGCWAVVEDIHLDENASKEIAGCLEDVLKDWSVVDPKPLADFYRLQKTFTEANTPPAVNTQEVTPVEPAE